MTPEIVAAISKRVYLENSQEFADQVTTTDATPTVIKNIALVDDDAGMIEVRVIGKEQSNPILGATTHYEIMHYSRPAAGLTLQSLVSGSHDELGASVGIATDGFGSIDITVTGVAATTIAWDCYVKQWTK